MARTINEIYDSIAQSLKQNLNLSASAVAEWRLWVNTAATALHTFEIIQDKFKKEVDTAIISARPGTLEWYRNACFLFQNGHELVYDDETSTLKYPTDDPAARITAVAAVQEHNGAIILRVGKDQGGEIVPFSPTEKINFENFICSYKIAGSKVNVISTTPDLIRYRITVIYKPTHPVELIEERTAQALEAFKTAQQFGGVVYPGRLAEFIMQTDGVVTASIKSFERKGATDADYMPVEISAQLEAGYFNYADECEVTYTPTYTL